MNDLDAETRPKRGQGRPRLDPSKPPKPPSPPSVSLARLRQVRTDPPDYSVEGFCDAHGISRSTIQKLWTWGLGPRRVKSGRCFVILGADAAAWREQQLKRQRGEQP